VTGLAGYVTRRPVVPGWLPGAERIDGWMRREELLWLGAQAAHAERVVEIGCWLGRSTTALAASCPGTVWTIDHFRGADSQPERQADAVTLRLEHRARRNLDGFRNLRIFTMESADAVGLFPESWADMVFIDADHSYDAVKADILRWRSKAAHLFCGHDYAPEWPGVVRAVDELLPERQRGPGSLWYVGRAA
jgi:Methyltransferase domain